MDAARREVLQSREIAFQVKASVLFCFLRFCLHCVKQTAICSISGAASVSKKAIKNRGFAPNAVKSAKVDNS